MDSVQFVHHFTRNIVTHIVHWNGLTKFSYKTCWIQWMGTLFGEHVNKNVNFQFSKLFTKWLTRLFVLFLTHFLTNFLGTFSISTFKLNRSVYSIKFFVFIQTFKGTNTPTTKIFFGAELISLYVGKQPFNTFLFVQRVSIANYICLWCK